jgi:hypothetical protein
MEQADALNLEDNFPSIQHDYHPRHAAYGLHNSAIF